MLEVLLLSLSLMNEETSCLGFHINWNETRIEQFTTLVIITIMVDSILKLKVLTSTLADWSVPLAVVLMRFFATLGSDSHIWRSSISLESKVRLYRTCILPLLLYSSTRGPWLRLSTGLNALDTWCSGKILRSRYTRHVTNVEVRQSHRVSDLHHLFTAPDIFRRPCRSAAVDWRSPQSPNGALEWPPSDWRRRHGRPLNIWLIYKIRQMTSFRVRKCLLGVPMTIFYI